MKFRRYSALMLAMVLALSLAACGGGQSSGGSGGASGGSGQKIPEAQTSAAAETTAAETTAAESTAAETAAESAAETKAAAETKTASETKVATETKAASDAKGSPVGKDSKGGKSGKAANGGKTGGKKASSKIEPIHVILTESHINSYDAKTYAAKANVDYALASLADESAEAFPALAKGMEAWNKAEEARSEETLKELETASEELHEYRPDIADDMTLSSEIRAQVYRADSAAVSIFHDYYVFQGGVHGYYSYSGVNFDPETGNELKFTDVVKDPARFWALVDEIFQTNYTDIYEYMTNVREYMAEHDPDNPGMSGGSDNEAGSDNANASGGLEDSGMCWAIDSEGLTVYFNPYILGSYAMGAQSAKIFFADHPEVFVEKYTKTPDSYVLPVVDGQLLEIDADGDGKREKVEVLKEPEDPNYEYGYLKWVINVGDRTHEINDMCYDADFYIVKSGGQYYLYIFEISDNDYQILGVFDLKTMSYDTDEYLLAGIASVDSDWTDDEAAGVSRSYYSAHAFTDPEYMPLVEHMEILGTRFGQIHAKAGDKGYPEYIDPWYTFESMGVLQANVDVECDYVDEEGKIDQNEYVDPNGHETTVGILTKGTYVMAIRSDGKSWIDLVEIPESDVEDSGDSDYVFLLAKKKPVVDGSKLIYRVYTDGSEWPHKVGGIDEGEAFRGIQYAG